MLGNPHGGRKKMKLTGKFWWRWLWIWHLYKYCGNSRGLRLWSLQAVFIHNNDPQFSSMQYMVTMVTNFENYQSWILGPSQRYSFMLEVPTMGRNLTCHSLFLVHLHCKCAGCICVYQNPSETSQWVTSCLYFYHYSVKSLHESLRCSMSSLVIILPHHTLLERSVHSILEAFTNLLFWILSLANTSL